MTSPEQIAATIVGTYDDQRLAADVAEEIVFALRDAGYLIEGGERLQIEYSDPAPLGQYDENGNQLYGSLYQSTVWRGPWRPVEEEDGK